MEPVRVDVVWPEEPQILLVGQLGQVEINHLTISITEAENLRDQLDEKIAEARRT